LEKPEQSLTQEKRGTLNYPTLTSSFVDVSKNSSKEFEYPHKVNFEIDFFPLKIFERLEKIG